LAIVAAWCSSGDSVGAAGGFDVTAPIISSAGVLMTTRADGEAGYADTECVKAEAAVTLCCAVI